MNLTPTRLQRALAVVAAGAALSFTAHAQPVPPFGPPPGMTPPSASSEAAPMAGDEALPSYLQSLKLTAVQREKIFTILDDSEPQKRALQKALKKPADALRDLAFSEQYDESRAKTLAEACGKVAADLALLRVHTDRQILAVLTPEQRQAINGKNGGRSAGHHE